MAIDSKSVVDHFGERMTRLAIYEPLFKLKRKIKKDNNGVSIPYFELGMLTLLFFFEKMIIREKNSGVKELTAFIYETVGDKIALEPEAFESLSREIIEEFRPSSGIRNSMEFYNWETKEGEKVFYSILKAARSDVSSNAQYYTLDEAGLELIFSSREYFSEFQISISQLLLRKQLEKGEFNGALRQIDEMNLAVEALRDRLNKIKNEVTRSIVSEETYERYKRLVEDINMRLNRENEEFDELQEFVRQTRNSLKYQMDDEKDKKAYELILKVDNHLANVHHEHSKLLKESIILKTSALEAAQQALYYIGIDSFNFQQDVTNYLIGKPLPLTVSKILIEPFLPLQREKIWLPTNVFQRQRIEKTNEESKIRLFAEGVSEEIANKDKYKIQTYFSEIMKVVLEILDGRSVITLEKLCEKIQEKCPAFLSQRLFYDFWIILHQKSPIELMEIETDDLLYGIKEILDGVTNHISVKECDGIVRPMKRFVIKNVVIDLTMYVEESDENGI